MSAPAGVEATGAGQGRAPGGIPALSAIPPVPLLLAGVLSIQFGTAFAATLFDRVGVAGVLTIRLTSAAVILLAIWRPWRVRMTREGLAIAAALGLVLGCTNLSFYSSADRLPFAAAVTIEFLGPIAVAVLLSRRLRHLLWVALAVAGVVLLMAPWESAGALDRAGVLLALTAAVCWALYIILAQRVGDHFDQGSGLAVAMVVATAVPLGPGIAQAGMTLLQPGVLAAGCLIGVVCSVIPYTLEIEVLRRIPVRVFGVLMSSEPALAAVSGFVVLGQSVSPRALVAILMVVLASVGATRDGEVRRVDV